MRKSVKGKVVLITGGASGMGKELGKLFAKGGARVVLWDVNEENLDKTRKEFSDSGFEVYTYRCDVTNAQEVYETKERVFKEVGFVEILDNNAGVVFGGEFLDVPDEKIEKMIDVNFKGVMWCTKAFLPEMIKEGRGHLIMMSSASGLLGVPGLSVYAATKWGIIGFSESLRLELLKKGHRGIKFTIVCPSFVKTGMFDGVKPPKLTPWLEPQEIAQKIYKAVLKEKLWVLEPFMVKTVPFLKGSLPAKVFDKIGKIFGMDRSMDTWHGRGKEK